MAGCAQCPCGRAKRNSCLCREIRYEPVYTATSSVPLVYVEGKHGEYYGNCSETLIKFQRRLYRSKNNRHNGPIEWERTALQHAVSFTVYQQMTCRWPVIGKRRDISLERQPLLKKPLAIFSGLIRKVRHSSLRHFTNWDIPAGFERKEIRGFGGETWSKEIVWKT